MAADSLAFPGIGVPTTWVPRLPFAVPATLSPFARAVFGGVPPRTVGATEAAALRDTLLARERAQWLRSRFQFPGAAMDPLAATLTPDTLPPPIADTSFAARLGGLIGDKLGVYMVSRFESKLERNRNERCLASQFFSLASQCGAGFQPSFDLQFRINTGGTVADRLHINVDYDSEREFDASNNMNIWYAGKSNEFLERLEFGNITLQLPQTSLITSGIPAGNFGFQAVGQFGPLQFRGVAAQQKGNIPKTYEVVVGGTTVRPDTREREDYQFEARRFFFTVDPLLFGAQYPNIDILNGVQMRALAEALPENTRPRRLFVYKVVLGGQPPNPNGPRFQIIGDPEPPGHIYQLLQENRDYYTDPSQLWIALPQQLNLETERLVIAYTLRINGRDTVIAEQGGTPVVSHVPGQPEFAHLLWDPDVRPGDPAFRREIRSVYQVAGEDLRRQSVSLRILTGSGLGQERPVAGNADTYLQMFGLSQSGNPALFDVANRLWPRTGDPNIANGGAANAKIIRDYFLVFPSVRPFAADGLVQAGNPLSDTIYVTPSEDLYSQQHPPSRYRLSFRYDIEGGANVGTLTLNAVQLRRNSEIVSIDGIQLARDTAYTIDYELGTITFTRPDTLFPAARARRVSVRYEENPLFTAAPTSILAFSGLFPMERGSLGMTLISQSQATAFTRPPLGYEPQSSMIAGVNGTWNFEMPTLSRLLERIPTVESTTLSRADLNAEFATSRPQPNSANEAYVETFENEGGQGLPLQESAWFYSSQPALGLRVPQQFGGDIFNLDRATTMAWQGTGLAVTGQPIQFQPSQIDPQLAFAGGGVSAPETILWMTLYPLSIGGLRNEAIDDFQWKISEHPVGVRRWRSLRTSLGAAGTDMSRVEYLTFWTLVDTTTAGRPANPSVVIDLGDVSENSIAFGPQLLTLTTNNAGGLDSAFSGKALIDLDVLNSERDPLTRSFNQELNDTGIPGDRIPFLNIVRDGEFIGTLENFATCARGAFQFLLLGDARNNCTVQNGRLDEEDLDGDNNLNFVEAQREAERVRRYIVDLANPASYNRIGGCTVTTIDTEDDGSRRCWVQVRIPFGAPDDSLNGGPNIRRIRAARMTVISGVGAADTGFTFVPIAQFKFQGSALIKRSQFTVNGIAGDVAGQGFTIATVIGTQDRDTTRGVNYESPPGVTDEAERQQTGLENLQTQINERSLRLLAGRLEPLERAEAFLRFPEGARNFMNYRELRVWARGRGAGWGQDGELQFFVKVGRDAHNFYMYRTPINSGAGRAAWLPEIRVDFDKFFALRAQIQNNVLQATPDSIACTGVDSLLIERSGLPVGQPLKRRAACADGYMVYTVDPLTSPPSLSQVQEIAVGMVRVAEGGGANPIVFSDTLELWVDDVRLGDVERTPGYAGQLGFNVVAGDVASFRFNGVRRDGHFRQLAEQPTFLGTDAIDFASAVRLERLLPGTKNFALPFNVAYTRGSSAPLFLSQTDIPAGGIQGLRTPLTQATRYSMSVRRAVPMSGGLGVLVNNLFATANYARADSRSEYSEGGSSVWNAGVDYNIQANPRTFSLPAWLSFGSNERAQFRWNPTLFRVSTELGKASDERRSFTSPARSLVDTGRVVRGLNHVMRTTTGLAFRPVTPLNVSWDFTTTRDLRDYGDTSATSIIASRAREELLGVDLGLERERQVRASLTFNPAVAPYLRPTFSFTTNSFMQQDPQSRQLVRTGDSTGAFRLPRRLSNSQVLSTGASFDPSRAIRSWFGEESMAGRITDYLQSIDAQYSRTLSSNYDGSPFSPSAGYELGLGGRDDFFRNNGFLATVAGASDNVSLTGGLRVGNEIVITNRALFGHNDNFTRRLDNTHAVIRGSQRTIPDLSITVRDSLAWLRNLGFGEGPGRVRPFSWLKVISTLDINTGVSVTRQESFAPAETETGAGDERSSVTKRYPFQAVIGWNDAGALLTDFTYNKSSNVDSVPGSATQTRSSEIGLRVTRSFQMPQSWRLRSKLQLRIGWHKERSSSYISVQNSAEPSRLADNGSTRIDLNAESELATNLRFSLLGARVVTFDNNYNRKFSQFFLTAAFSFIFQTGEVAR